MTKAGKFKRHPAVLIFGGKSKRWKRRAELAGFSSTSIELMSSGLFESLNDEDQNLLLDFTERTPEQLVQDHVAYLEERDEVRQERRDARKERRVQLYGRGGYPADEYIDD